MVRGWRREAQAFIKRNLIGLISVILAALLGIGAWALSSGEISYTDPGPAIATVGLAIVVLIIGLVINNLQAQNQNLSAEVNSSREKLKQPILLPPVIGLDILVNRWQ